MRLKGIGLIAGVAAMTVGLLSGQAAAQIPQSQLVSPQILDQMSQDRLLNAPHNYGPVVPQGQVPAETITPLPGLWVCKSSDPYSKIYAQPSDASPVIGETLSWVAVGGANVGDYSQVLTYSDKPGYVKSEYLHPFFNKVAPQTSCTVEGIKPDGLLAFDIR